MSFYEIYENLKTGNIVNAPLEMLGIDPICRTDDKDFTDELGVALEENSGVLENLLVRIDFQQEKFVVLEGAQRLYAARKCDSIHQLPIRLAHENTPYFAVFKNKMLRLKHKPMELADFCQAALSEGYTQKELAEEFGIPKSTVCELVKFTILPNHIKEAAQKDSKKFNHHVLRKLAKLEGDAQEAAFQEILKKENKKATTSFSSVQKQLERTLLKIKKLSQEERNRLKKTVMDIMTELDDSSLRTTSNLEEAPVTRDTETVEASTELPTPNSIESSNAPSFSCEVSQGEPTYPIVEVASETQAETPMQADHQIKDAA